MPKGDKDKLKADPEDGTTPVSHLLLEAVAIANLNGTEKGILLHFWRITYGWLKDGQRKTEAPLGQELLSKIFDTSPRTIYSAVKSLTDKNILIRKDQGPGKGYIYRMNTSIATWNSNSINFENLKVLVKAKKSVAGIQEPLPLKDSSTLAEDNKGSNNLLPLKDSSTLPWKKTSTLPWKKTSGTTLYKEILNQYKSIILLDLPANEVKEFLTFKLAQYMLANNPKVKIPENLNSWVNEIRLMLEVDKRTPEEILKVIEFSQKDPFWWPNILSAGKLRKQFDQLFMKMQSGGSYGTKKSGVHKPGYSTSVPTHYEEPEDIFGKPSPENPDEETAGENSDG